MAKHTLLSFVLLLAAAGRAQELPMSPALARAVAVEDLDHDLGQAKELLRKVAEDGNEVDAVRRHAWLRLARLQRRMGEDAADALARAAVGDDAVASAARELQAQGQGDPEREAELQKKAEAAVEMAVVHGNPADAIWFGDAAVPAAIRAFEARVAQPAPEPGPAGPTRPGPTGPGPRRGTMDALLAQQRQQLQNCAMLLWQLPGERAERFLAEGLAAEDVKRRRAVASGIASWNQPLPRRMDLVQQALRDPDAEVVVHALEQASVAHWTSADLLPAALDERGAVRSSGLKQLASWAGWRFQQKPQTPELRADSEAIAAELPRLLSATTPSDHRNATLVAAASSAFSRAGRSALVWALTGIKVTDQPHLTTPSSIIDDWDGTAENAAAMREVMERLGPVRDWSASKGLTAQLAHLYIGACWDRSALDVVLAAWRLAYLGANLDWLSRHAKSEDAGAVVAGLAGSQALRAVAGWLKDHDLPESAFAPLRETLSSAPNWQDDRDIVLALGRTGHPDATGVLLGVARARADHTEAALQALCWLATERADGDSVRALRAQLFALLPMKDQSPRKAIAMALGVLVRLGDREILDRIGDLTPAFHRLVTDGGVVRGVTTPIEVRAVPGGGDWPESWKVHSPVQWLTLPPTKRPDGTWRWWHGYSAEDYRAIWQRLLAPPDSGYDEEVWRFVDGAMWPLPDEAGADAALVQTIADAVLARITADAEVPETATAPLRVLLDAFEKGTLPEAARDSVARLREAAFTARAAEVRAAAVASLTAPFDADGRRRLLQGLADASGVVNQAARRPFEENLLPLDREVVEHAFRSPQSGSRQSAFPLLRRVRDDVPDLLRGLVTDPDVEIRFAACQELGQSLRLDAVPALLEALKDSEHRIRDAATQALQAIRFYHDEKAHWDRVFAGRAGLTATSAAEALLAQAKPGNDAATRVLAIRSLGVLGAPETQPFLIEWTKDPDAEVAAAAREAVGQIHAGTKGKGASGR